MKAPISSVIADVISEMGKNLVRTGIGDDFQAEIDNIVSSALSVAAEVCADDGLAKARASKRMDRLRKGLEDHVIGRETRARANGRSYLLPLLEREFPTERKKRPKKARPPGPPSGP
jgi:hypothetical protein